MKRVLLVENEQPSAVLLAELAEDIGFNTTLVSCLCEFTKLASLDEFDLIVTDYHLGDGSAEEILKRLEEYQVKSPIAVWTGDSDVYYRLEKLYKNSKNVVTLKKSQTEQLESWLKEKFNE